MNGSAEVPSEFEKPDFFPPSAALGRGTLNAISVERLEQGLVVTLATTDTVLTLNFNDPGLRACLRPELLRLIEALAAYLCAPSIPPLPNAPHSSPLA